MFDFEFSLERIIEDCPDYNYICNMFLELVRDDQMKVKMKEILYNGKYKDFDVNSNFVNNKNSFLIARRRISLAYLLLRNPDTFDILVEKKVILFHGTNSNALPTILKYGLRSGYELEKAGINVTTGEEWSRIGGKQRDFISFTDVLDISMDYSMMKPSKVDDDLSFEVVIGTSVDDVKRLGGRNIPSDIPEVGIKKGLPLESIKIIGVPSDKVQFVKSLVNGDSVEVVAIDGIRDRFFYFDVDAEMIYIDDFKFNKLKENLNSSNLVKFFKLEEIRTLMVERLLKLREKFKGGVSNGRKH